MVLREPDWVAIAVVVSFWLVMTVDFTRRMAATHRRRRAQRHAEAEVGLRTALARRTYRGEHRS